MGRDRGRQRLNVRFGPVRHVLQNSVSNNLALSAAMGPVSFRARGVRETQHSVTVADAGSNPAGSTLHSVEGCFEERTQR